jgi:hypothetical protein
VRAFLDDAAWSGAEIHTGPWGAVVLRDLPTFRPTCGRRTIHVAPIDDVDTLAGRLPPGRIECIGLDVANRVPHGLDATGVSRVCPIGRMQRPALAWPRGGHPPLASLLGRVEGTRRLQVDA